MSAAAKQKGSTFEREICRRLSLWITDGKRSDVFWRSAMSGGRATVARKHGADVRQAGDITAVAPEGHALTDVVFIECKHYAKLDIESFVLKNQGTLAKFWAVACKEALARCKEPWLIVRQNRCDILLITSDRTGSVSGGFMAHVLLRNAQPVNIWRLDDVLAKSPWKKRFQCASSRSTSTASAAPTKGGGRVRLSLTASPCQD